MSCFKKYLFSVLLSFCSVVAFESEAQNEEVINPIKLDAAVHVEKMTRSEQKGSDTLVYNAAAYQVIQGADSESLLSKMPGVAVSDSGIEAGGKEVTRILLDGQEFFGNDVLTALRTIPADMIKQIEVINRLSDNAQMTGVDDGEGYTAINIVTKKRKSDGITTGRFYGSYGLPGEADDRGKLRQNYIAGGNLSRFGDDRTINVIGMSNNISKFNFTSSDIVSGVAPLYGGSSKDFNVKELSGISSVHSLGANYSDKRMNFSYFFNEIDNTNSQTTDKLTMTSEQGRMQDVDGKSDYDARNLTHRFSGKMTFSPAKQHKIIVRPEFSYENQDNNRNAYSIYRYVYDIKDPKYLRNQLNITRNDRWTVRAATSLNYRYAFKNKRRRSLSLYARYSYYESKGIHDSWQYRFNREDTGYDIAGEDMYYTYIQTKDSHTGQHSGTAQLTYTEPLGKRSVLAVEYTNQLFSTDGDNIVSVLDKDLGIFENSDRLSGVNNSRFLHNRIGGRYSYGFKKMNITAGIRYQHTAFRGRVTLPAIGSTDRGYHHVLYNLRANIPFNKSNTLKVEAKGYTSNPSNSLLQDVVNMSSTSNIRAGNPDLTPAYLHKAEISYIHTGRKSASTFSFSASYTGSASYFCDSLVINNPDFEVMEGVKLGANNQYVKPINLAGYHKIYMRTSFGIPITLIRCNFNVNAIVSMRQLPSMINEEYVPIRNNWYQLEGRLDSNVSKNLDFMFGYNARYYTNEYRGKFGLMQNDYLLHRINGRVKWIFLDGFTLTAAAQYRQCVSTEGLYNDKQMLCDVFFGYRFFKNSVLEVSAGVNDLFNDNTCKFWHTVNASGTNDGTNIALGRYFSVQLIWHLRS